ncbi:PIN domain-containing protein [Biomaibacter acetigenes]|uniref:PIN domain-containing protein n=1 Tax=Biomaibacter acetigenes TaxID=2316383 RepID=A0A3G2R744_9FIRM|nr:PIN domain-containing protein [Biomaibacter acetigenes]AYO31241.1 PIN domain-containing protein [Biomaibacter acetigenes]MDN5311585.1 hypothetical protein [Thermoanaerobacteraceae bacterium]
MSRKILVDTSALYEIFNKTGYYHESAMNILKNMNKYKMIPILTNFIVAEIYTLILIRVGADKARAWIKNNIWHIERITEEDEKRAINILLSYTDKTFSYTDATTFALMERLNIDTAFTFDKHFVQYGFKQLQ